MMGRASEPEMLQSIRLKAMPKLPHPQHFGTAVASQDRQERVTINAGAGDRRGSHSPQYGQGPPGTQDQPYETEHERAGEPEADTAVRREETGWTALTEAEGQGEDTVQAARRCSRQRGPKG